MALTMLSTALPPPVGASSKNGRDEAKPAFFGGCPSFAYISLPVANSRSFFFFGILGVQRQMICLIVIKLLAVT